MLSWITNYFYTWYAGPARNAPNDGINIKKLIESKPDLKLLAVDELTKTKNNLKKVEQTKKISSYFCITPQDLQKTKSKLNHCQKEPLKMSNGPPLIQEFDTVFKMGYKNFLEQKRLNKK